MFVERGFEVFDLGVFRGYGGFEIGDLGLVGLSYGVLLMEVGFAGTVFLGLLCAEGFEGFDHACESWGAGLWVLGRGGGGVLRSAGDVVGHREMLVLAGQLVGYSRRGGCVAVLPR